MAGPGSRADRCGSPANSPASCSWGSGRKRYSARIRPGEVRASGLRVSIDRGGAAEAQRPERTVKLDLVGAERPGIVRDVTQALTGLGVNIEEFASGLEGEPFTGVQMFHATARLSVPESLKLEHLRKALERLAAEIMVDLNVGDNEPVA